MQMTDPIAEPTAEPSYGTPRRREWAKNLAVALVSLLITCLVLEVALRILVPEGPPGTSYGKEVHRNSLHLRDHEFAVPKPAGVQRVLVLGDSFTWGVGLDLEQTIPKRLQALLAEQGESVEVINAAHPGDNTIEELLTLEEIGPKYEPDLVLVVYNLNDIEYRPELAPKIDGEEPAPAEAATPVVEIDPGEDITQYSKNSGLRGLVLAAERRSILVRFLVPRVGMPLRRMGLLESVEFSWVQKIFQGFTDENPGWRESQRGLLEISEYCRARDCEMVVAIYPLLVELDDYKGRAAHAAVAEVSRSVGATTVDLLEIFEGTSASSHWINVLDSHPDAAAHEAVAEALLPDVLSLLARSHEP